MWKCEPLGEEIKRIRKVKTEREKKRLDPDHLASLDKRRQELKTQSDKELVKNKLKNADKN
jgi:hypothetical protein